jgi:transcriptional regulator with XRE-family HTH domain
MKITKKHNSFGELLRSLREKTGQTLKTVAKNLAMDTSLLAKIERNERQPTKQIISQIAQYFNVDMKQLQSEFLSDQIAYKILDEDADLEILKVAELFAGVGGFRIGLEGWNEKSASSNYKKNIETNYEVVWSNQWEPSTKIQHASMVYENKFGKQGHSNKDISSVDVSIIPDHDLLVGGFPCQDYSVATTLKNSKGLIGKKGVLWWSIHKILSEKENKPKYLFLENVDRLLISPSGQRGRDFAIILKSLNDLGIPLLGWAFRSNFFSFLKKGFPLLSQTQKPLNNGYLSNN